MERERERERGGKGRKGEVRGKPKPTHLPNAPSQRAFGKREREKGEKRRKKGRLDKYSRTGSMSRQN